MKQNKHSVLLEPESFAFITDYSQDAIGFHFHLLHRPTMNISLEKNECVRMRYVSSVIWHYG